MQRDAIDFHKVLFEHEKIHERLVNWARYVRFSGHGTSTSPMFRAYRSAQHWNGQDPAIPIDNIDGHRIEKAVAALPEKHMNAVRWQYVYFHMPVGLVCRKLAVQPNTLHKLVQDGRSMLKNRLSQESAGSSLTPDFLYANVPSNR